MLGFNSSRRHGERGAVSSVTAICALLGAVVFTGAQVIPLALKVEKRTELNQAFTLAVPRAVRVGTTDSSGRLAILPEQQVKRELVDYLKLFKTNVASEAQDKSFCVGVYDLGDGTPCSGWSGSTSAEVCPRSFFTFTDGKAKGWRFDEQECEMPVTGRIIAALLGQAGSDARSSASWDRYYVAVVKLDDETLPYTARVDISLLGTSTGAIPWVPPPGSSSAGAGGVQIHSSGGSFGG